MNHPAHPRSGSPRRPLSTACAALLAIAATAPHLTPQRGGPPWTRQRQQNMDRAGGLPAAVLRQQGTGKVVLPELATAIEQALAAAAAAAGPLIDRTYHDGRRLRVPADYPSIQAAIDAARARDVVVVAPGTYHELLVMKDGVRLMSDAAEGGAEPVAVAGARTRLPRRTLRTIIDGSRSTPSPRGLFDFPPGASRHTVVDGFTIQGLPAQDHHVPGHAHAINLRGASPVIMHCLIRDNGSTGIGNHVLYADQGAPIANRDFRHANIRHQAAGVIYRNIICRSLGRGIGCNHFAAPFILGNEVFENSDADHGDTNGPGIGAKHGATPTILGNIVHRNPGGGISSRAGEAQGRHPIDRPTTPRVQHNVVFGNGRQRPGISNSGGGSKERPVVFADNLVLDAGAVGIGLVDGAVGIITGNVVGRSRLGGIAIHGSTALRLADNKVSGSGAPGFLIVAGAEVSGMTGNLADGTRGPRFLVRDSTVHGSRSQPERKVIRRP